MSGPIAALTEWVMRRHRWVIAVSLVLIGISGYRTFLTYSSLRSDLEELLPSSAPSVAAIAELRRRLPGMRFLGVVLEVDTPAGSLPAERFLERLGQRIRQYPPDLVRAVRTNTAAERRFAETYALQLMEPGDVRRLREAVEARRDFEVSQALDTAVDEAEAPPPLPLDELRTKYEARFGGGKAAAARKGDGFVSPDGRSVALLVQTSSQSTGYEYDARLLARVKADAAALGGAPAGTTLGYAGDVATRVEETQGLASDLTLSSALVLLLVVGSVVWFYRSWAALVVLFVPLSLGTWAAFALVALPPLSIRYLNTNTAFLGSIVIGNGINSGIILLARIQEELGRKACLRDAVTIGVAQTWRGTLAAAVAAAAAYGSLVFTSFRGFNQFGWIGGFGILSCWLAMYVMIPALCVVLGERLRPRPALESTRPVSRKLALADRIAQLTTRHRRAVLIGLAALSVISFAGLAVRRGDWIEYDLSKLRRKDSWENGERYWGKRLDAATGRYLTPTVLMPESAASVPQIERRLRKLVESGGAGDLIADVRSAAQLLPESRFEAIEEGRRLQAAVTPKLRAKLAENERQLLDAALSEASLVPLRAGDLPEAFVAGLRERDGRVDRSVLVFPKVGGGTWQAERLSAFAGDVRSLARESGATVAGPLLLSSDLADAMKSDGPRVTLLSFSCVILICWGAFGAAGRQAWAFSGLSIAALLLGVTFMLGLMAWTGQKLNFSNFVALPITFGIGADYSINMLRRYQSGGLELNADLSKTSGALALCSATTVIGWGSLLMAENQALFSFGVFAITGELMSLSAAVLAIPAALAWFTSESGQRRSHPRGRAPTALG